MTHYFGPFKRDSFRTPLLPSSDRFPPPISLSKAVVAIFLVRRHHGNQAFSHNRCNIFT